MNGAVTQTSEHDGETDRRLKLSRKLQAVTNLIHETEDLDALMRELSQELCDLFACDRLTIYTVSDSRTHIETRFKTGLRSFKDFSLSISRGSIAGYVALFKKTINLRNVYDTEELNSYNPSLNFVNQVDVVTGYKTRQLLTVPIVLQRTNELQGVIQLINNRLDGPFSAEVEEAVRTLCDTLAIAFSQRLEKKIVVRSKYDPLVVEGILSMPELGLAFQSARRKGADIEETLVKEFQVKLADIGNSLSQYFNVVYEPFAEGRLRAPEVARKFSRDYVVRHQWLPIEANGLEVVVLTTHPEKVRNARLVEELFPNAEVEYRVTTNSEFRQAIDHFFDGQESVAATQRLNAQSPAEVIRAAENELLNRINTILIEAFRRPDATDIHITLRPGVSRLVSKFHRSGALESISGQTTIDFQVNFPVVD